MSDNFDLNYCLPLRNHPFSNTQVSHPFPGTLGIFEDKKNGWKVHWDHPELGLVIVEGFIDMSGVKTKACHNMKRELQSFEEHEIFAFGASIYYLSKTVSPKVVKDLNTSVVRH